LNYVIDKDSSKGKDIGRGREKEKDFIVNKQNKDFNLQQVQQMNKSLMSESLKNPHNYVESVKSIGEPSESNVSRSNESVEEMDGKDCSVQDEAEDDD